MAGALALALAMVACDARRGPATRYEQTSAQVDSMLVADRLEQALATLRGVEGSRAAASEGGWLRDWAAARAASIDRMLAVTPAERAELAATARPVPAAVPEGPTDWQPLRSALQRRLEARRRILGSESPEVAATLCALGRCIRRNGEPDSALAGDLEALEIRRRWFRHRSPEVAESHWMLGCDYRLAEVPRSAAAHLDTALDLIRRLHGPISREYAGARMEQVNMLRWRNATDAALRGFDEILSIRRRLDGPRSLPVADVLTDIAATRLRRFEWAKIARLTREAVAIQDVHGSAPTEGHALSLNMLGLALRQLGRLDEADAVLHRAVAVQEARRKASPAIEPHRSHMHRLAAWADLAGVQLLHGDSLAAWESQERALSRTWLERSWARGDIDSTRCWDHMLERVQARLSDSTAMIGWVDPIYVPGHSRSPFWGYVIRRTGPVRWIEMQSTARDPLHAFGYAADEMRWRLVMVSRWPFRIRTWDEIKRLQRDLWDLRVASLEPFLDGVRELVVVSPSIDYLCPLELMRDDHGRILGDRFAITYEPSALHYIAAPDPARESRTRGRWSGILIQPRGLAATDREVARLARHLRDPRVLSGETATEAAVRRLEAHGTLREADLLHFASHGYATSRIEPIMLELSGADSSGTHPSWNDGFLTLDELERWELHTRLLTLSACGFGFQEYSQGAFGFGRSLSDAGARSVVMSILPVEDEAASLYMRYFYDALFEPCAPPRSIAESMRVARMRLRGYRDPAGGQPFAHPMYWSAFVLLGDPG